MTTIVQQIQEIRSMQKNVRDIKLAQNILTSIESIHNCIKSGADSNGWKKVEWRNGNSRSGKGQSHGSHQSHSQSNGSHSQSHGSQGHAFESRQKNGRPPISIPLIPAEGFRPQKYVSKFKKASTSVDDTILNTILLGKLNKFSQKNYNDIKEFITHIIDNGETDMIKCFMKLVFEKAASEETFCPLYAKLLSELSEKYPILLSEMDNLYSQYMEIFDEIAEVTENYNEFCKQNIVKKYRRGYSQFLAELIKYDIIQLDVFIKIINKIIIQIENNCTNKDSIKLNEELSDCLMKITKAIKSDMGKTKQIRDVLKIDVSKRIHPLTLKGDNIGMSNKARFTLLDIYESIQKF